MGDAEVGRGRERVGAAGQFHAVGGPIPVTVRQHGIGQGGVQFIPVAEAVAVRIKALRVGAGEDCPGGPQALAVEVRIPDQPQVFHTGDGIHGFEGFRLDGQLVGLSGGAAEVDFAVPTLPVQVAQLALGNCLVGDCTDDDYLLRAAVA